jgi:deoxycytidylate deaminase
MGKCQGQSYFEQQSEVMLQRSNFLPQEVQAVLMKMNGSMSWRMIVAYDCKYITRR